MDSHLVVFKHKQIRRILIEDKWYFAVVDVVAALTDSDKPRDYWYRMKIREAESSGAELSTLCRQLKLVSTDGKKYLTEVSNTEGIFRIIQSIPSPKAEPFKRWLAKVGYEHVQEIEDPELAAKRTRELYKAKGYSEDWIEKRMRGIAIRDELTDEWKKRDVKGEPEYAILTSSAIKNGKKSGEAPVPGVLESTAPTRQSSRPVSLGSGSTSHGWVFMSGSRYTAMSRAGVPYT